MTNLRKKLAREIFGSKEINLTDDEVGKLDTLVFMFEETRTKAIEECAAFVEESTLKNPPTAFDGLAGLKWNEFNSSAQHAIHGAVQMLAGKLRTLK